MIKEAEVSLQFKGGGSTVSLRPQFSSDGENIFIVWKNCILQYGTKSGKLIHEYKVDAESIINFTCHNYNSYQCLTICSQANKVIVWKTVTHYKILEKQLPIQKIRTFNIIPSENEDELTALVSYLNKDNILLTIVDIKNKRTNRNFKPNIKYDKQQLLFVDVSDKKYFSVAHDNCIQFSSLNDFKSARHIIHKRTFTSLVCHPSEDIVLTGDSSGRVIAWQNIFSRNITQAVFHWHTLPVRSVCFSTTGSYFYSGGEECVLVKWQLSNANDKKFLPRLPAEIEQISVANNNLYVALATADNAIRILDNHLNQVTLIQHLVLGKQYESGIVYDPRTKALIMNGNQGHLQFYSPSDMTLLYSIDIVSQNKITNERDCLIQNTEITRVAVSRNGLWLATVEERKDKDRHSEIRLKFWNFDNEKQIFELNTWVEYPHDNSICNILFQPIGNDENLRCVTVGSDKKFKIWHLMEVTTVYKTGVIWKCFGVGFYRDLHCSGLSFSVDGSLIAIGFESILTTWAIDNCNLKCSLIHPSHKEKIKQVQFGNSCLCHLLVSASANQLSVWNILTLCMLWTVPVLVDFLISDPFSTHMVALTQDKKVYVFSPISHVPIYSNDSLLEKQRLIAATFVPGKNSNDPRLKWYERSHLYFINAKNELFYISNNEDNTEMFNEFLDENKSIISVMMPNSKLSQAQSATPSKHLYENDEGHQTLKKYLDAPIHTMAPIRFLCHSLIKSLVIKKIL